MFRLTSEAANMNPSMGTLNTKMNVAITYLQMSKERGLSEREAIRMVCDKLGLSFSPSYVSCWKTGDKPIPPRALYLMQQEVAHYATKAAGIAATAEKAKLLANMLAPALKDS